MFLNDYPNQAPSVKFLTTGQGQVRFNPNLYNCGKVCLSLLGTWSGPGWQPNKSTLLQVLVSIQGLVLVEDPYFNEPGYETSRGTTDGTRLSNDYNKNIRRYTLQYAMLEPLKQLNNQENMHYQEFNHCMRQHFLENANAIKQQVVKWLEMDSSIEKIVEETLSNLETLSESA